MSENNFHKSRRDFIGKVSAGTLAYLAAYSMPAIARTSNNPNQLALLGGVPVRNAVTWPEWPYRNQQIYDNLMETAKSGKWSRIDRPNSRVSTWENDFKGLIGTNYCVATGSGTQSLNTALFALNIGPGDEVITSPYTDMGTVSAIITCHALPVLADLDPNTYQLDPNDIEKKITPRTKAIVPVHMLGFPADMDRIMAIARKHNLLVVEDACQSHLVSYKGKKLGTFGQLGCFSFQSSKQISCGEGGAVVGNDEKLMDEVYAVMNHGTAKTPRKDANGKVLGVHVTIGPKYRMNEFQAAVLQGQLSTIQERFDKRWENGQYLTAQLKDFPGLKVQKQYPGTENGAYYLFGMSYQQDAFDGITRNQFLKAINAEGIGLSGYIANGLHREPWVDNIAARKSYRSVYGEARMKQWREQIKHMPNCDKVCAEMAGLYSVGVLLGTKKDMDSIVEAIMKVYKNRSKLKNL